MKYERDFAKAIGSEAWHGKWFEFWDVNGKGFCQPDLLLRVGDTIVILECKYTWVIDARWQILKLYKPVVEATYGMKAVGVTVCKNLIVGMPRDCRVHAGLEDAIKSAITGDGRGEAVLHWIAGPPWTALPSGRDSEYGESALASL